VSPHQIISTIDLLVRTLPQTHIKICLIEGIVVNGAHEVVEEEAAVEDPPVESVAEAEAILGGIMMTLTYNQAGAPEIS